MIMVTGASGALGSLIAAKLAASGREVVAGTRRPTGSARRVDFDAPDSLAEAFGGVDVLVAVSAGFAEDDVVIARHRAVVEAAANAGVRQVVYTSLTGAGEHMSIAPAHRATERLLAAAPFAVTVLRNGLYAELLSQAAEQAVATGVLTLPLGGGKVAAAAREDLAEAAARVAVEADAQVDNAHRGRVYELVGSEALGGEDLASALSAEHGKEIAYAPLSLGDFRAALTAAGLPPFQVAHTVSVFANVNAGFMGGTESDLPGLLAGAPRRAIDVL
ncbi:NmrA family NAD(P)-binding protein [Glycomyces harbinensis]|uniref:NAD(P)H dehydrogenase (Quinone) n=1 Tax=Glycomyces harbinensis TaxID=58114 RepID=A0A1G6TN82_9ACTN|nr:NmrA family NAD(P)-binding protein [Glycomyces harbinensis]SDD30632.1 NAD(P)H dehydrogenase (quinone) [Glycomyces harbinensis]